MSLHTPIEELLICNECEDPKPISMFRLSKEKRKYINGVEKIYVYRNKCCKQCESDRVTKYKKKKVRTEEDRIKQRGYSKKHKNNKNKRKYNIHTLTKKSKLSESEIKRRHGIIKKIPDTTHRITEASKILGLSRMSIYLFLKKYPIK